MMLCLVKDCLATLNLITGFILFSQILLLLRGSSSCCVNAVALANLSEAFDDKKGIGLERTGFICLIVGQILVIYLSVKSISVRMFADNVSTQMTIVLAAR